MAHHPMDDFCGSTFWDLNITWYTYDPDLTPCFQQTVLVWTPCAFLWTFLAMEIYYITNSKNYDVPWSFWSLSKLFLTCDLIILTVADISVAIRDSSVDVEVFSVSYYTPIIKILTFILTAVLIFYNRKHGLRTSGLLWLFWFLLCICAIPQFRSEIRRNGDVGVDYRFVSYMIYFPLIWIIFLLNCFADKPPRKTKYPKAERPCPEGAASFLSRMLFAWFDALAWKGFKKSLTTDDLWAMNPEDSAVEVVPLFDKHWQKSVEKANSVPAGAKASFSKVSASVDFNSGKPKKEASILPALCKAFGPTFLFGSLLKLSQDIMTFVSPQILRLLIQYVDPANHEEEWKGYFYAALLFGAAALQTLVLSQYFTRMFLVGLRIRTALISAIYRKALRMSNSARKESTVGEIVNLMSVDAQRFMDLTAYINMIWSAPLQIALALYFLWDALGPSVLAGLAVMIILIPVNGVIANKVKSLQIRQMKCKDERVKLMNEVLSGIKVLKLYAWEPSFEAQVLKIRGKEIQVLKEAAYLNAGTSFIWSCAPFLVWHVARLPLIMYCCNSPLEMFLVQQQGISCSKLEVSCLTFATYVLIDSNNVLTVEKAFVCITLFNILNMPLGILPLLIVYTIQVSLVTFATFVLVDENNILDSETAFVSLSLFNILRFPLSMLPMMISNMVQAGVSVTRLNKFMNCEELDPDNVQHDANEENPLVIENGTFAWEAPDPILRNINLSISRGSLQAIVGTVGSGKSSLLSAFLGEMDKLSGRVNTSGSIAYVSQQAWIQNATLQDNILFGKDMDKALYNRVVEACALKPDIDMLPGGDQTEIGEKGINLSGGQKQRVSLARAVYNDGDVYFLDDPLSAVDSHVGKHIFENVIGPSGILKKKTRILVTHGITYLPQTDNIAVLAEGEITESGTYKELLDKKGAFAEFLVQHLQEVGELEEADIDEIKQQLEQHLGTEELNIKLQQVRSRTESQSDSVSVSGSLTRQHSDSGDPNLGSKKDSISSLRRRSSAKENGIVKLKEPPAVGEKLIDVEKAETGSVKWRVYSHYLRSIGIFLSVSTIILNMIFQGFSIGSNMWLSVWSSDKNSSATADTRDMYLGVYGALGIGQVVSTCLGSFAIAVGSLSATAKIHNWLLSRVLHQPMPFFDTTPVGRVLNRFSHDVNVLDQTLPMNLRQWIPCFFRVVSTLVVISISTPIFVSVIVPIGFLYYFIQRFYVASSRQLKRLESVTRSPIYSHFGESVTGAPTIRAYSVQERFITESESKVDNNQLCQYPSIISNRWLAVRLEMIGNLIILFSALFAVIGRDSMNPGLVGLSISYALQITQTLNWLVRMTSDVETNIVAVERIKEYAETEQEAPWDIPATNPNKEWPQEGKVEFQNFQVRYREGLELVLRGVSFTVEGGEKVGIVGRTGAGKSSLTLALFRIIEAAGGKILIDDVDISKLGLHALRSRLTIIPQDPVLFSGTLRLNLDPFDTHSDEEVWRALEHAHLKSFIKGLPAGINHEVSEGGENLSVGQRQLVCLARALLRKTKVLVLDEATAAVDLETDDLIQRTIRTEFKECTILTIAHRLNTILDSDKVIVLDKGTISEFANPQELLQNRSSAFYSMAKDAGIVA